MFTIATSLNSTVVGSDLPAAKASGASVIRSALIPSASIRSASIYMAPIRRPSDHVEATSWPVSNQTCSPPLSRGARSPVRATVRRLGHSQPGHF